MPTLDEELRETGARWRAEQPEPRVDVGRAASGSGSRLAFVAAGVSVVVIVIAAAVLVRGPDVHRVRVVGPTTGTTLPVRSPEVIELNSAIVQPDVLAVDGNRLWVSGYAWKQDGRDAPAHLQKIDATTGALLGDITLPDDSPFEIRVVGGIVWVAAQQAEKSTELLKIDAATMRIIDRVPGVKSTQFAVSAGAIWSPDGIGALRRIAPETASVVASIPTHTFAIYSTNAVVSGPLGVFVGNGYDGTVQRIDVSNNTVGPDVTVGRDLADMVELGDTLWVLEGTGGQLVEVAHGTTVGRVIHLGERALTLATDGKSLWLGVDAAHALRVDPETGSVTRIALPACTRGTTVAADPATGAVWATSMVPTPRLLRVPAAP